MLALLLLLTLSTALAGPVDEARAFERDGDFVGALGAWRSCVVAADPRAEQCRGRVAFLEDRRHGGDFGLYGMLQEARRAAPVNRARSVPRLRAVHVDGLPDALHRDLGLWLLAELRATEPEGAAALGDALWTRHRDGDDAAQVADAWGRVLADAGRLDELAAVEAWVTPERARSRQTRAQREGRLRRRDAAAGVAWVLLALFVLPALPLGARGGWRGARPWGLVPLAVFVLGGGLLAEAWEAGLGRATAATFGSAVLIHGLALGALCGTDRAAARSLIRLGAFAATLAAGYLALRAADLLGWVGL